MNLFRRKEQKGAFEVSREEAAAAEQRLLIMTDISITVFYILKRR